MKSSEFSKVRYYFWLLVIITFVGIGIALSVVFNAVGLGWLWGLVVILLAYLVALAVMKGSTHEGVVTVLEQVIPGVHTFVDLQKKKYGYRGVIDNAEYVLKFYQLTRYLNPKDRVEGPPKHYSFSEGLREDLLEDMFKVNVKKTELEVCIESIAARLNPPIDKRIIKLLHKEIFKEDTQIIFTEVKNDVPAYKQLAWVLMQSGRLPPESDDFPYDEETVSNILLGQETFSLKAVQEALLEEERIWKIVQEYLGFLVKNNAAESSKITLKQVQGSASHEGINTLLMRELSNQLNMEERRTLSAMMIEGEKALKRGPLLDTIPDEALSALTLTSLAMFFTEERLDRPNLKSAVCKLASRSNEAVDQHLAYLQAREELRPESPLADLPYVSVRYVADNWERIVGDLRKNPHYLWDKDIAIENLRGGDWWTRVPLLMKKLFSYLDEKFDTVSKAVKSLQKKYPAVEDVLRRIFRGLKLETIERLLEAQTSIPYLLTFDGQEGNLAEVIDSLSYFDGKENRAALISNKVVTFKYKKEEKYFFKQYTRNSRLGVVPKGMSFEQFSRTFEKDLIKVYEHRKLLNLEHPDINKFEIIIHRFGLHGRDRYGFEKVEAKAQNQHALPKIRDLFASSFTPQEILNAIIYEQPKDKNGSVNLRPILEGILEKGMVWDFTDGENVVLTENAIKTLIKRDEELKKAVRGSLSSRSLLDAVKLLQDRVKADDLVVIDKAKTALQNKILELPGFKKLDIQAKSIADNYVDMLVDIGSVLLTLKSPPAPAPHH